MEEKILTAKEMLYIIWGSDWPGKGNVSQYSSEDAIIQAYYQMIHAKEQKATKSLDLLVSDAAKRIEKSQESFSHHGKNDKFK